VIFLDAKLVFIGTICLLNMLFSVTILSSSPRADSVRPRSYSIDKFRGEYISSKKRKQEKF
jgi:hypothetical protein